MIISTKPHTVIGTNTRMIYIAGAISAPTESMVNDNCIAARDAGIQLLRRGWAIHNPHMNTYGLHIMKVIDDRYNHDFFMRISYAALGRCDAIFMLKNWEVSKGATMELMFAEEHNMRVYYEKDGYPLSNPVA